MDAGLVEEQHPGGAQGGPPAPPEARARPEGGDAVARHAVASRPLQETCVGKRVCIVSAFSGDYVLGHQCWRQNEEYAKMHGHDARCEVMMAWEMLRLVKFCRRPSLSWCKTRVIANVLAERAHDWVVWIDADAFVVHKDRTLQQVLSDLRVQPTHDLVVAKDLTKQCRINAGVLLVRNTAWSRKLFSDLWAFAQNSEPATLSRSFHEQSQIEHLLAVQFPFIFAEHAKGNWRLPGSRGNHKVLICDNEHFNTNCEPCRWIYHGAGRAKGTIRATGRTGAADSAASALDQALAAADYNGCGGGLDQLWRAKPLRLHLTAEGLGSLAPLEQAILSSPFPYLDLRSVVSEVGANELQRFLCEIVPRNSRIDHVVASHNRGLELVPVLVACRRVRAIEAAGCALDDQASAILGHVATLGPECQLAFLDLTHSFSSPVRAEALAALTGAGFVQIAPVRHPTLQVRGLLVAFLQHGSLTVIL